MLELLTPTEAATELRVSRGTIYHLLNAGRVAGRRIGGQWRIARRDLDAAAAGELAALPRPIPVTTAPNASAVAAPVPLAKREPHPDNVGWL